MRGRQRENTDVIQIILIGDKQGDKGGGRGTLSGSGKKIYPPPFNMAADTANRNFFASPLLLYLKSK